MKYFPFPLTISVFRMRNEGNTVLSETLLYVQVPSNWNNIRINLKDDSFFRGNNFIIMIIAIVICFHQLSTYT